MRTRPPSLSSRRRSSPASMAAKGAALAASSRSPAAVRAMLRVLRLKRRMPSACSRLPMLWLRADLDRPSCCAAAVKLPQRARGEAVFYEIYAEADKRRDPDKRHTGIFMFKGRDNAPFAMIAAGGLMLAIFP